MALDDMVVPKREGLNFVVSVAAIEDTGVATEDPLLKRLDDWYAKRKVFVEVDKKLEATNSRKRTALAKEKVKTLRAQNQHALSLSPQNDPEELLQQLELLERLHRLYVSKDLMKCILSAYLYMTKEFRWELLSFLGSTLVPDGHTVDQNKPPPDVYLRLAKIPEKGEGLGDKGFEKIERFLIYFNRVRTPRVLRSRKVKQYHELEMVPKRAICTGRYVGEVDFSRLLNVAGLQDVIPYDNIKLIPYMLEWGHAEMNLALPLRKPGKDSGLPADYWKAAEKRQAEKNHTGAHADMEDDTGDTEDDDADGEYVIEAVH
jgi:hypothetical protein